MSLATILYTNRTLMMQNFTPIQLVAYLYGDNTTAQAEKTEAALAADPILATELDELSMAQSNLPKIAFTPPKDTLRRILWYSEESRACALC